MQENTNDTNPLNSVFLPDWGVPYQLSVCEQCDWSYLVPRAQLPERCPNCFVGKLERLDEIEAQPLADLVRIPELFLPFSAGPAEVNRQIENFTIELKFPPEDLTPERLQKRMKRVFLPVWLVDAEVRANWQAEAGFNYQVKSHQENFGDGAGWKTREVVETRQRWELRLGKLVRGYNNVSAPALENHHQIMHTLGDYSYEHAAAFSPEQAFDGMTDQDYLVRLPGRDQRDAWPDIQPRLQSLAGEECRQACGADHIREFRWIPEFTSQNWTLMLLPVLTTFYLDDENQPQQVLIHGQSGRLSGKRRASMRRARGISLTILMVALLFFVLSLCAGVLATFNPVMLPLAGVGIFISLAIALGAIYPVAVVWSINRAQ